MTEFKNPELNKKFVIRDKDKKITLPEGFTGMLSEINKAELIEAMIKRGSNLVDAKPTAGNTGDKK